MRTIFIAAALLLGTPALAAPPERASDAAPDPAIVRLRAQNDALRERMGQMQLDLLIAEVIARGEPKAAVPPRREAGVGVQVVAFRR